MRLVSVCNAIIINSKENQYTNKDGQPVKTYNVSFDADGEVGTLNTTEECYLQFIENKYKPMQIRLEYNDQYRSMRVIGCSQG